MKSRSEQCKYGIAKSYSHNPKICPYPHSWAKPVPNWNLLQTDIAASESNTDPVWSDTKTRASLGTNN